MKNDRGFSIVQVIISMGLLTGLIVAGLKIMQAQTKVGKSSSFYFESIQIVDEIKTILSDRKSCALTFENKSAYFETLKNIFSADSKLGGDVEYRVHTDGKPLYGETGILIENMELNGNSPEFGTSKGLSILKISFVENRSRPEKFSFEIPVHVETNEMGRVQSCFTLPGINGSSASNHTSVVWSKSEKLENNSKSNTIHAHSDKVVIGKLKEDKSAALSIEGSLKLGNSVICDITSSGLLSYEREGDILKWCNSRGEWENLNNTSKLISEYKDFNIVHRTEGTSTTLTDHEFRFCQVHGSKYKSGICWVRPIQTDRSSGKWELISQYIRGEEVKCSFRCFR